MARHRDYLTPAEADAKGWRCRTHLKADRLMPGPSARPAGIVWQGRGAYDVYEPADCVPWKWEPGPTQLRRRAVAARAQELLSTDTVVLLDTETTGVGEDAEIIEIAILDVDGTQLLNTLVRPTQPIPAEATAIHRITDKMVASAPTWPEVAPNSSQSLLGERSLHTTLHLTSACCRKPFNATA